MNPAIGADSPRLKKSVSSFALAAAITALFNTLLAWAKDAYAPLNSFMKSLTGHHWITHGLADLVLFVALGLIFQKTQVAETIHPNCLTSFLVGAVVVAVLGLALWYLFF